MNHEPVNPGRAFEWRKRGEVSAFLPFKICVPHIMTLFLAWLEYSTQIWEVSKCEGILSETSIFTICAENAVFPKAHDGCQELHFEPQNIENNGSNTSQTPMNSAAASVYPCGLHRLNSTGRMMPNVNHFGRATFFTSKRDDVFSSILCSTFFF